MQGFVAISGQEVAFFAAGAGQLAQLWQLLQTWPAWLQAAGGVGAALVTVGRMRFCWSGEGPARSAEAAERRRAIAMTASTELKVFMRWEG